MPNFQAVSRTTHADKRWKRYDNYAFAAKDALAPLVAQELPRAAMHLPIGFVVQDAQVAPVAVLGFQPGQNLFVTRDGRWIGGYTPAAYRGYPFQLAASAEGQNVLVVDEASGLVSDSEGEPFFDGDGNPAKPVKDLLDFLGQVQANRIITGRICAALAEHQIIEPWPITVQAENGERQIQGLHRINEAALKELSADALKALQQAGALPMIYCQLLSMQHLPLLGQLAEAHRKAAQPLPTTPKGELDLSFLSTDGAFKFGGK